MLKRVGSVTGVIVRFEFWHPHSHERAINSSTSHDRKRLFAPQDLLMLDPHRACLLHVRTEIEPEV